MEISMNPPVGLLRRQLGELVREVLPTLDWAWNKNVLEAPLGNVQVSLLVQGVNDSCVSMGVVPVGSNSLTCHSELRRGRGLSSCYCHQAPRGLGPLYEQHNPSGIIRAWLAHVRDHHL